MPTLSEYAPCKWLIAVTNGEQRNTCGYYGQCPEINNLKCTCPAIEKARAYEISLIKQ